MMGMGDSLGEGVQSANAFTVSQQQGYLNYIATQAKVSLPLPLISSTNHGAVGSARGRSRVDPKLHPLDVAVSGATVNDVLTAAASSTIKREVDLVMQPYTGLTQIDVVERVKPGIVFCWVGSDDIINYVLDYQHLNAPRGITSLTQFTSDYRTLMSRLKATGSKVVVGNIPDLTQVAFLFDNNDLTKYLGQNYNLPAGSYTTFGAMLLIKLGKKTPAILTDPAYVLDATQIANIRSQVQAYNAVISQQAAAAGFPVVDAYSIVNSYITNPLTIEGVTITTRYNGGAFSLDGIHPSDTGYTVFANAFITAANTAYGFKIPVIPMSAQVTVFNADPFVDFNGNGVVPGRPNTGLLETLGPKLGVSGDTHEHGASVNPSGAAAASVSASGFMQSYFAAKGMNPFSAWNNDDVENAVSEMLNAPR